MGIRRAYYINELFDESNVAPDFSSNMLISDTTGYLIKYQLSFDNEASTGWIVTDDSQHKTSIENGRLRFESKVTDIFLVFLYTKNIDIQSDFSYELNMEYSSTTDMTGQFGIVFGNLPDGSNGTHDPIEYFSINKNKKMYMGNRTWYSYFTELTENQIIPSGRNKLKVCKTGKFLYYFINGVYSYCSEIETSTSGFHYGFMVPPNGVVLLDNLSIAQRTSSGVTSKIKQNQVVEFEMTTVKSLNQNLISK
jgi:hypothetical protein